MSLKSTVNWDYHLKSLFSNYSLRISFLKIYVVPMIERNLDAKVLTLVKSSSKNHWSFEFVPKKVIYLQLNDLQLQFIWATGHICLKWILKQSHFFCPWIQVRKLLLKLQLDFFEDLACKWSGELSCCFSHEDLAPLKVCQIVGLYLFQKQGRFRSEGL